MPMIINREDYDNMSKYNKDRLKTIWLLFGCIPTGEEMHDALKDDPGLALFVRHIISPKIHKNHLDLYEDYSVIINNTKKNLRGAKDEQKR